MSNNRLLRVAPALLLALMLLSSSMPAYADSSWWNYDWQYRKKLTFDNSASAENLVNFPVLVHLDDTNIDWTKVQNAGEDIRFIDSNDSTELDYEIEEWDDTNNAWIWVEAPQIDANSTEDFIYMYYSNSGASDGQDVEGTWNSEFMMVQHLQEDPSGSAPQMIDSTTNDNDGTSYGTMNSGDQVAGQIDGSLEFDGGDDYIDFGSGSSLENFAEKTLLLCMKPTAFTGAVRGIFDGAALYSPYGDMIHTNASTDTFRIYLRNTAGTAVNSGYVSYTAGAMTQIGYAWNGTTVAYYKEGASCATPDSFSGTLACSAQNIKIARVLGYTGYFSDIIDEVWILNEGKSGDWVEAAYFSMTDAIITYGSEEYPPPNPPTNFTITDNGANSAALNWSIGAGATNTTIICKRESVPESRTDGETIYTSNSTSYTHTGLSLETTKYYYAAWGWSAVQGYSAQSSESSIGGEGMEEVATGITGLSTTMELMITVVFNLTVLGIALWRREGFLYLMAAPVSITFGWYWAGEQNLIAGIGFSAIGAYCIYLAVRQYLRSRG